MSTALHPPSPLRWPDLPFPIALVLLAIGAGLASGLDGAGLVAAFGRGFGRQQGYFALVLLFSMFLAAAISQGKALTLGRLGVALSPLAGAGMVCPDTAYAALAPVAAGHRTSIAAGSYAGFKLLLPAGPLLIGVGLAAEVGAPAYALTGLLLLVPVLAAGLLWLRLAGRGRAAAADAVAEIPPPAAAGGPGALRRLLPLSCLGALLLAGFAWEPGLPALRFLTSPVGALAATSVLTYGLLPPEARRECLDAAVRRTAPLLLVIGSAAALGSMLAEALPLARLAAAFATGRSHLALVAILFAVTAAFKMINGSSMATFAAVPPVLAPVVAASSLDRTVAAYAICLGSFVAVLPNDSFFWITQPPEAAAAGRRSPDLTIAGLSIVQGLTGLACLGGWVLLAGRPG